MSTLAIIFLILSVAPALLPRWRDTLIASGIIVVVALAIFLWALMQLDQMTTGEGPAFFAIIFYFGLIQFVLGCSFIAKFITLSIAKKMHAADRPKLLKYLVIIFIVPMILATISRSIGFVGRDLVAAAWIIFSPILWVSLAIYLLPDNSFKPTPQSGAP
jgi:hypothetical protein